MQEPGDREAWVWDIPPRSFPLRQPLPPRVGSANSSRSRTITRKGKKRSVVCSMGLEINCQARGSIEYSVWSVAGDRFPLLRLALFWHATQLTTVPVANNLSEFE